MTPEEHKERNAIIYRMRVEEKKTLDQIASQFGLCRERIRQILFKIERLKAAEERRRAADQDTIGAMQLSIRLRNCFRNENYPESTRVIDVLERMPLEQMIRIPTLGKKTIKEFTDKAEAVVGVDAIQRWLDGRPLRD